MADDLNALFDIVSVIREQGEINGKMSGIVTTQEQILNRLQGIEDRQLEAYRDLSEYHHDVKTIQDTLEDGLKTKVNEIAKQLPDLSKCFETKLSDICDKFDERLKPIEDSSWFLSMLSDFGSNYVKYSFAVIAILVLVSIIVSLGDKAIWNILGLILKALT